MESMETTTRAPRELGARWAIARFLGATARLLRAASVAPRDGGPRARGPVGVILRAGAPVLVFALVLGLAQSGFAQDLAPVNEVAEYIQGFLTGRLATSLAVIAVALVGYLFWAGRIAGEAALGVVGGIALVFGSAQIVAVLEAVAR